MIVSISFFLYTVKLLASLSPLKSKKKQPCSHTNLLPYTSKTQLQFQDCENPFFRREALKRFVQWILFSVGIIDHFLSKKYKTLSP